MLFVFCIKNRTQGEKKRFFFIYPFIFNMSYSETSAKRLGLISDIIAPINSHSLSLFFLLKLLRPKKKKKKTFLWWKDVPLQSADAGDSFPSMIDK